MCEICTKWKSHLPAVLEDHYSATVFTSLLKQHRAFSLTIYKRQRVRKSRNHKPTRSFSCKTVKSQFHLWLKIRTDPKHNRAGWKQNKQNTLGTKDKLLILAITLVNQLSCVTEAAPHFCFPDGGEGKREHQTRAMKCVLFLTAELHPDQYTSAKWEKLTGRWMDLIFGDLPGPATVLVFFIFLFGTAQFTHWKYMRVDFYSKLMRKSPSSHWLNG